MDSATTTPEHERLREFDAAVRAKQEADAKEVERRRQLLAESITRDQAEAEQRRNEKRRREEHAAKRGERWAALPRLTQALYMAAAERPMTPAAGLIRMAQLLTAPDYQFQAPPATFEA
jgi:hypothetical protein